MSVSGTPTEVGAVKRISRVALTASKAVPALIDVAPYHSAACYLNSPGILRGTL